MAGVTGVNATLRASRRGARSRAVWLGASTAVGVVGPILAAVVLRDSPDPFVAVATVLVALPPVAALIYAYRSPRAG